MPSWTKVAIDAWTATAEIAEGALFRGVNKGDRLTGESLTSQGVWRCVEKYSDVAPHDLRRTYAKLAHTRRRPARSDPAVARPRFADDDRALSGRPPGPARCALRLLEVGFVSGRVKCGGWRSTARRSGARLKFRRRRRAERSSVSPCYSAIAVSPSMCGRFSGPVRSVCL